MKEKGSDIRQDLHMGNNDESREETKQKGGIRMKQLTLIEQNTRDCITYKIPELSEMGRSWARSHERRQWAHWVMSGNIDGQAVYMGDEGLNIQRVDDGTVRVLSVTDHEWSLRWLSVLRETFEACNIEVQIDPYTVLMPYIEEQPTERTIQGVVTGMEVA